MGNQTAFIDGPFDPATKPWLLSHQREAGIAVQREIKVIAYGVETVQWDQPHGYMRGGDTMKAEKFGADTAVHRPSVFGVTPSDD